MKKYIQLLFVAIFATLPLVLTSCGDDEPATDSIVGIWFLSQPSSYGTHYCVYNFKANGIAECKDWSSGTPEPSSYEWFGTWSVSGSTLTLNWDNEDDYPEIYRISVDANKLIIYDWDGPGEFVFVHR